MITNIVLDNFKCFRKLEVNPRLITVFIGPNGTGKSSVLQALALLKQSVGQDRLVLQGRLVNLGDMSQILPFFAPETGPIRLGFSAKGPGGRAAAYEIQSDARGRLEVKKREPAGVPEQIMKQWKAVPTARGLVRTSYSVGDQAFDDISQWNGLGEQEQDTATNLAYGADLIPNLSDMLKRITGVGLRAPLVPPRVVQVQSVTHGKRVNIVSEGFGSNALIPLLERFLSTPKDGVVLIEEPEIHLHPKAQAELASLLAEEAKAEDKQIIMTTHSEHILNRLLTLVAEKKLSKDELAVYAFEKDEKGECTASRIEIFEDGRVKGGLKDFFQPHLDELNRYVEALQAEK